MNAVIRCEIRLSKKLEKLVEPGEPIEIYISPTKEGVATGVMRIVTANSVTLNDLNAVGETSIIMRQPVAEEMAPNLAENDPVQTLFTDEETQAGPGQPAEAGGLDFPQSPVSPAIGAVAYTNPESHPALYQPVPGPRPQPPNRQEMAQLRTAVAQRHGQYPPQQYPPQQYPPQQPPQGRSPRPMQQPGRRKGHSFQQPPQQYQQQQYPPQQYQPQQYQQQPQQQPLSPYDIPIMSYDEMMHELQQLPGVEQQVPSYTFNGMPGSPDERQSMLAYEEAIQRLPHLRRPCYVRNDVAGRIDIQDLGRTLMLDQVFDLSVVPARRILDSRHLRDLCRNGQLNFVGYNEFVDSLNQPDKEVKSYLPVGSLDGRDGDPPVEPFGIDGSGVSDMYVERHNARTTSAQRRVGMRRAGQAEFADNAEPVMDPEFADLVRELPRERSQLPAQTQQRQQRWQPPQKPGAARHTVRPDHTFENGTYYVDDANGIYTP